MVSIHVTRLEVMVRLHGWDKLLAMRGTLSVPLSHVRQVRARPEEARFDDVIVD
jgi:hypothetical protein